MNVDGQGVSVVIPVRNGARHIVEAVESCLAQSRPPREIIVVDDGSEDGTIAALGRFGAPVVVLRQPWLGKAAATNTGIAAAHGGFVAFLDHDDLWASDKLALQLGAFGQQPELDVVFGMMTEFISPEADDALRARLRVAEVPRPGIYSSTMLARRESLRRFGPFEGGRDAGGFMLWHTRAVAGGLRFSVLPQVTAYRRLHATNSGIVDRTNNREQYLAVAREMVLRHRKDP